jgi:hypothetical protein
MTPTRPLQPTTDFTRRYIVLLSIIRSKKLSQLVKSTCSDYWLHTAANVGYLVSDLKGGQENGGVMKENNK